MPPTHTYLFEADRGKTYRAIKDLREGAGNVQLWSYLGLRDVRDRFRGAVFGAFWAVLTTGALALGLAIIYGALFGIDFESYFPYVTVGLTGWAYISSMINESTNVFVSNRGYINQIPMPLSLFIFRMVFRNFVFLLYRCVVIVLAFVVVGQPLSMEQLKVIPGLGLLILFGIGIGMVLGPIATRYRDLAQAISAFMTLSFFITPIIWYPSRLREYIWIVDLNPLYQLLQMFRAPLLGEPVDERLVLIGVGFVGLCLVSGVVIMACTKPRIPYWL